MEFLLVLHIGGAGIVGSLIIFSLISLFRQEATNYAFYAKTIALGGAYELLTGSLLSIQLHGDLTTFCQRIGVYCAVIFVMELSFFFAMKKGNISFPVAPVVACLCVGLVTVITTGIYLVQ